MKISTGHDIDTDRIRAEHGEIERADHLPDRDDALPSQTFGHIVVHGMDEPPHGNEHRFAEEEDVFGHGASLDEHIDHAMDNRSSVGATAGCKRLRAADGDGDIWPSGGSGDGHADSSIGRNAMSIPALAADSVNLRCMFIERQGTDAASRNLATLSIHREANRVMVLLDGEAEPRLVCDLGQLARARRASPYAILLEKLDVRLVCTTASADALHQGAKSAQACCQNCGGTGGHETMWTRAQCSHTMCLPCVKEAQLDIDFGVEHDGSGVTSFGLCPVCVRINAKFRKVEAGLWTTDDQEAELHDHRRHLRGGTGGSGFGQDSAAADLNTLPVTGVHGGDLHGGRCEDKAGDQRSMTSLSRQASVAERMARLRERIRRRAEGDMQGIVTGGSPAPAAGVCVCASRTCTIPD